MLERLSPFENIWELVTRPNWFFAPVGQNKFYETIWFVEKLWISSVQLLIIKKHRKKINNFLLVRPSSYYFTIISFYLKWLLFYYYNLFNAKLESALTPVVLLSFQWQSKWNLHNFCEWTMSFLSFLIMKKHYWI